MPSHLLFQLPVEWTKTAERDLRCLDKKVVSKINNALARYVGLGHGNVRVVRSADRDPGGRRELALRAGNYRVLFYVAPSAIRVERILNRNVAYRQ